MTGPRADDPAVMTGNLGASLPSALAGEVTEVLAGRGRVRIERIVSLGQVSADGFWYDQDEHEFVLVVAGSARLEWADGTEQALGPGDWAWIPAHLRHRVSWTDPDGPTVWLAVFAAARPGEAD